MSVAMMNFTFRWILNSSPEVEMYVGRRNRWVSGRITAASPLAALELLFERFNHGAKPGLQPEGFRSMSVGDFVQLAVNKYDSVSEEVGHYVEDNVTWVCCGSGWQVVPASEMV